MFLHAHSSHYLLHLSLFIGRYTYIITFSTRYFAMNIRPITSFIHRFSLVLILNNKFLHTLFRHAHSPRYQLYQSLFIGLYTYIITFSTRYFVMHIRPVTSFIHRFSLVLILNNKFLHTLFRHAHSPRYQLYQSLFIGLYTYIITFSTRYFVIHICPVGGIWEGFLTNYYPTFICTSPPLAS